MGEGEGAEGGLQLSAQGRPPLALAALLTPRSLEVYAPRAEANAALEALDFVCGGAAEGFAIDRSGLSGKHPVMEAKVNVPMAVRLAPLEILSCLRKRFLPFLVTVQSYKALGYLQAWLCQVWHWSCFSHTRVDSGPGSPISVL